MDLNQTISIYPVTDEDLLRKAICYAFDVDMEYLLYIEENLCDYDDIDREISFFDSILRLNSILFCYKIECSLKDLFNDGDFVTSVCDWLFLKDNNLQLVNYLSNIKARYHNAKGFSDAVAARVNVPNISMVIQLHVNILDIWLNDIKLGG